MTDDLPSRFPDRAPDRTATIAGVPVTIAALFAVAMIVLALIGAGATFANVTWAEKFWLWLVPVFGLICTAAAWMRTGTLDRTVLRQVLHWLAVGVTIAIDFSFFRRTGEQTSITTSLNSLLFLALGCLAGGHPSRMELRTGRSFAARDRCGDRGRAGIHGARHRAGAAADCDRADRPACRAEVDPVTLGRRYPLVSREGGGPSCFKSQSLDTNRATWDSRSISRDRTPSRGRAGNVRSPR
ncbi:MAG: hypothetical protein ACOY5F_07290 [Pseudomonadota bacterium]